MQILLNGTALLLLVPVSVLAMEVLFAVLSRSRAQTTQGVRQRVAVLVPAHNEESSISETLRAIATQLQSTDRLVVIADNCSDATGRIAKSDGAEVIERRDTTRRGKGYALDFGIRHLESGVPPDIVVFVDADCEVSSGAIDRLARLCVKTARPTQALYLMRSPRGSGLKTRIGEFAWVVKNQVRPMGLHLLGLPCQLMGSGMAFPWSCIKDARLATGHIVEDLKLGIDLARAGLPPVFCPEALVISYFPASSDGVQSQRKRWEHGHLGVILREIPRLVGTAIGKPSVDLTALTFDLLVPPLALLTLMVTIIWLVSAVFYRLTSSPLPLVLASIAGLLLLASVLLSWSRYGRRIISLHELIFSVIYALWKIPLYVSFMVARQTAWIRSKRNGDPS